MPTYVELLPKRSNRRQPAMQFEPLDAPEDSTVGHLTLHNDRDTCVYRIELFPADVGFGVCLHKLLPGTDASESHYCLSVSRAGAVECECKGYMSNQHCRHSDAVRACLENKWL